MKQAQAEQDDYTERLAMRLAGEGSFAMEPLACVALNRLRAGWNRELLLDRETTPFYAPDVPVEPWQVEIVSQVLNGQTGCDERLYYALGSGDSWRPHEGDAILVIVSGPKSVLFFGR
ncbi:MAG: hypothetical protein AAF702_07180 [Chloroflexota bacterium]